MSLILAITYLMLGTALYFFQEKLLFLSTELEEDYQYKFENAFEELNFYPEERVVINALLFKSESPRGVILYSHGNAGDLSRWGQIASELLQFNYDVLVWDYRGYGKSVGPRSEQGFYQDIEFLYDRLNEDYTSDQIIIYGRSLGTGVSSYLAAQRPCKQLILETPFYSITDVAKHRFPIFPVETLMTYKFPSYEYLPSVNAPITIFHGTDDAVVPYKSAKNLSATGERINLITIEGAGHNDLADFDKFRSARAKLFQ